MDTEPDTMVVKLTLRRGVAERLRAICHARGETASLVVDRWIVSSDASGNHAPAPAPARRNPFGTDDLGGLADLFGGLGKR